MSVDEKIRLDIQKLEESLWKPQTRFNFRYMKEILAADFLEIGRSGNTYDKAAILHSTHNRGEIDVTLPLCDLVIEELSNDVILVNYISNLALEGELVEAYRTSIWIRGNQRWLLRFHQGTPL